MSRLTCIVSLFAFVFVRVKAAVSPSPLNLSVTFDSSCMLKDSSCELVPVSKIIASSVKLESSSVAVSNCIPPPTILTKPEAALTLVSALFAVKVSSSPTSYFEPTSSMITSLTEPSAIPSTTNSANPFPIFSTFNSSPSAWSIPSFTRVVDATIASIVNVTSTSLVDELPVIVSPSTKVPLMFASLNSVTDVAPCCRTSESITTAVALDVPPVITWLITSSPLIPAPAATLIIVLCRQSPSESLNIYSVG